MLEQYQQSSFHQSLMVTSSIQLLTEIKQPVTHLTSTINTQLDQVNSFWEMLPLFEVVFFLWIMLWSAEEIFTAFYTGYVMWKKIYESEDDISVEKGYKWLFMGMSMAVGAWAGSVALADLMSNIVS